MTPLVTSLTQIISVPVCQCHRALAVSLLAHETTERTFCSLIVNHYVNQQLKRKFLIKQKMGNCLSNFFGFNIYPSAKPAQVEMNTFRSFIKTTDITTASTPQPPRSHSALSTIPECSITNQNFREDDYFEEISIISGIPACELPPYIE